MLVFIIILVKQYNIDRFFFNYRLLKYKKILPEENKI